MLRILLCPSPLPVSSSLSSLAQQKGREDCGIFCSSTGARVRWGYGGEREQRQQDVPSAMSVYDPGDFLTISSFSSSVLVVGPSSLRLNLHYADVFPVLF